MRRLGRGRRRSGSSAPDAGTTSAAKAATRKGVALDFSGDSDVLLVSFASMRAGDTPEALENLEADAHWPVKRLYLRDLAGVGYHLGIVGLGGTVGAAVTALERLIEKSGAQRVVFLGFSVGAYAALLFGRLAEPDEVHAFFPQTTFDYDQRREVEDFRGQLEVERITSMGWADERYVDLRPLFEQHGESTSAFHIHYTDSHPWERFHAERLGGLPGVRLEPLADQAEATLAPGKGPALSSLLKKALLPTRDPATMTLPGVDHEAEEAPASEAEIRRLLQGLDVVVLADDRPQVVRPTLASLGDRRDAVRSITVVSALPVALERPKGVDVVAQAPGGYLGTYAALAERLGRANHGTTLFLEAGVRLRPGFFEEAAARLRRSSVVLFHPATRRRKKTLAEEPPASLTQLLARPHAPSAMLFRNEVCARRGGLDPWFSSLSLWEMAIRWYSDPELDVSVSHAPVTQVRRGNTKRGPGERYASYLAERGESSEEAIRAQVAELTAHRAWLHRAVIQSHLGVFTPHAARIISQLERSNIADPSERGSDTLASHDE